jgi:hypothetical protein
MAADQICRRGGLSALLLALLAAACVSRPLPPPVILPPPVQVGAVGITVTPAIADVTVHVGPTSCLTNGDGKAYCVPVPVGTYVLTFSGIDLERYAVAAEAAVMATVTAGQNTEVVAAYRRLQTAAVFAGRIRRAGRLFQTEFGVPWSWNFATEFLLLNDYLDGGPRAIDAVLDDIIAARQNGVRIIGMAHWIPINERGSPEFRPSTYGDRYFTGLSALADYLQSRGLYFEFTALADTPYTMPEPRDQRAFIERVAGILSSKPNAFLEHCNEPYDTDNRCGEVIALGRAPGSVLQASGSDGVRELSDRYVLDAVFDYVTVHSPRDEEWPRKAHDAMDIRDGFENNGKPFPGVQVPLVLDEPIGAADVANPGKRASDPNLFRQYGAASVLFGSGATFHSNDGVATRPFSATQKAAQVAFSVGVNAIPASVSTWRYNRGGLSGMPIAHSDELALRTFAKMQGPVAYVVVIGRQPGWRLILENGYSCAPLVPEGDVLICERAA